MHNRLRKRYEGDATWGHRRYCIAVDAACDPDPGARKRDDEERAREASRNQGAPLYRTVSAQLQIDCTVHRQHRDAHDTREEPERIEELDERSGVVDMQVRIEMEWNDQEQVAERHAETP